MNQDASAALAMLLEIFPEFAGWWNSERNLHRDDDGSFTLHGLFAQFSQFFHEWHHSSPDQLRRLGDKVNLWLDGSNSPLDNAVATCFLENIAKEPSANPLMPF